MGPVELTVYLSLIWYLFIVAIVVERVRMRIESVEFHVSQAFPMNHIMVGLVEAGDQLIRFEVVGAHFAFSRQHLHHQWISILPT